MTTKTTGPFRCIGALCTILLAGCLALAQTLSPTSITFSNTAVGTAKGPITVTLTNGASGPLTISSISVSGNFSETSNCPLAPKTLPANASCKIAVTFLPEELGIQTGVLTVTDNAGTSPQTTQLSGTGILAVNFVPAALSFGNVFVDTTSTAKTVTLTNTQGTPLSISSITTTTNFAETSNCPLAPSTLAGTSSCNVLVVFSPTATGTVDGTLTVDDSGYGSPQTVQLSGTGTEPVTLTPTSLTFASREVGSTSTAQKITLKNAQAVPLTIVGISTSGDFAQSSNCPLSPQTLAAAASCSVSVTFTPAMTGTLTGTLTVSDNAALSTESVPLTGTGTLTNLRSMVITPTSPQAVAGTQLQLTATGTLKTGQTINITDAVTWSSSSTGIAVVSPTGQIQALAAGTTSITALFGSVASSVTFAVTAPVLTSVTVTPANLSVPVGANQQFTAVLNYSNGTSTDATSAVTWSSSVPTVATVGTSGAASTLATGSTTITATAGPVSGSTTLTVTPPQCTAAPPGLIGWWTGDGNSVDLAGVNSGTLQNGAGYANGEVAQAFSFNGNGASVLVNAAEYSPSAGTLMFWFLANGSGAMTGSITAGGNRGPGLSIDTNSNLLWEFGNLYAQSLGQVSSNQWHHVALTYSTSGSEVTVVLYLDGNEISTAITTANLAWYPQVVFGSYLGATEPSFVGSMDEISIFNQALSSQQIQQVYEAFSGGMCKPTLQVITLNPANPSIGPGASQQFTAAGTYSDTSTHDLTSSAGWTSSNLSAATINATGLAIGVAPGSSVVAAALAGQSGSTTLNVGPSLVSIQVTPATPTIAATTSVAFTATGVYSDGSQQNLTASVTWSANSSGATITSNGVATGVAPGQTNVTASVGTITGSATLTVSSATLVSIAVAPGSPTIAAGTTQQFSAIGTFSDESTQDLSTQVSWSSSNSPVATINLNGLATSFVAGSATITATLGTVSNAANLTVTAAVLTSISVTPANSSLLVGGTQQFTATGIFSDSSQQNLSGSATWASSNQNAATVSAAGLVTASVAGSTSISATFNSITGSTPLTVNNPPPVLVSIAVSPAGATVAVGFNQQFTAQGTFSDGSSRDVTSIVQWSSSAIAVATISNTVGSYGLSTGAGAGGTTITATSGSTVGTAGLTVTGAQLVSIEVTPDSSSISPGGTSQFTATGYFSDGTSSNVTSSAMWSSSLPTVATISNAAGSQGFATSTGTGSTRISAAYGSLLDSTTLSVQDQLLTLTITPASALLLPGANQQFTATATYLSGVQQNVTDQVTWTSSNPAAATITPTGLAVSTLTGQTTIEASLGALTAQAGLSVTPIQHVVVIVQENRSVDNLFQDPNLVSAGADILNYGINSKGVTIPLSVIDLGTEGANPDAYDLGHTHADWVAMCDLNTTTNVCAMDGADKITTTCNKQLGPCPPPPNPQFMYVNPSDVAPYFQMAETYTFSDRMFQTNQGPSFPAHQFIFSGTSAPSIGSVEFMADDPLGVASKSSGCIAPPAQYVELINPAGVENESVYPCFEHQTLSDLLDAANLSWRYYAPNINGIWTAPVAINHMCVPNAPPPNGTACTGADYTASNPKIVVEQSQSNAQVLTDIAANQLAQVTWVIPPGDASDHAQSLGCGPSWVTQVVNAVGNSPYWSNTAIIITWDDWGGWYDHVPPPLVNDAVSWGSGYIYGFRVPLLVISPYAKPAYISHNMHDFGSILKFVETTFDLPSLGYADVNADDLSDIFQYSQAPLPFTQITPPANNASCISDPTVTDPDND